MHTMAQMGLWLLASVLAFAGLARAEDDRSGLVWMSGAQIRAEFSGHPLVGIYPSSRQWTELIRPDGSSDYREGDKHWLGTWWIRDREFCFSYAPPGVGGCFRVTRISANCFELYEFESGQGTAEAPPNIAEAWNGRMWHADRPLTCEARPTV